MGIAIFWCVVWFHGTCGIQTSRRVSADYIWPELRRSPSTLLHMPYRNQGVVWLSVQSVFTRLFTCLLLVFLFPRICASVCQPITEVWTVFPPDGMRIDYEGALSRRLHAFT